ncbi:MAG: hypothetical protein GXY33_05585 [Phycisphaerae bacterium]|nr:hypothetical protein [Phycisphaerae bacterium]
MPVSRPAFAGWPMAVAWVGMVLFAFHASTHRVGAGDTWVAFACGRYSAHHGVSNDDPFSANSLAPGPTEAQLAEYPQWAHGFIRSWHPLGWVNQNWLTHVVFYLLKQGLGENALVVWKFAVNFLTVLCVYYSGRLLGANGALSAVFACFALFTARTFIDIRPQVFTNLLVAVFFVILLLTTYRNYLYIWLIVPLVVVWSNLHGGYLYVFLTLVPFVVIHLLTSFWRKAFVSIGRRGVYHVVGAAAVALAAMVVFNPYHLTNLTHTYVISLSENADRWRTVDEWRPAFDWSNRVGTAVPFLVMFIMLIATGWAWLLGVAVRPTSSSEKGKGRKRRQGSESGRVWEWPKIDPATIVIVVMTVAMAVKSRRFIPIAAFVAAPLIALFVDQTIRMLAARVVSRREGGVGLPAFPLAEQHALTAVAAGFVLIWGVWLGVKFYRVYLAAWPFDHVQTSVFMRMTGSGPMPFAAGEFIRANELRGKMFNYWNEGGFLAFAQEPDPETGRVPLQLFIDGRAQAAYDIETYSMYMHMMAGGPAAGRRISRAGLEKASAWLVEELKKYDVWIVVMPEKFWRQPFMLALELASNWRLAYLDEHHKILVDMDSEAGRTLFGEVVGGRAEFASEFSRALTLGHILIRSGDAKLQEAGLVRLIEALNLRPTGVAAAELANTAGQMPPLAPRVVETFGSHIEDLTANRAAYEAQAGFSDRLVAASMAAEYLSKVPAGQADRERYERLCRQLRFEVGDLARRCSW